MDSRWSCHRGDQDKRQAIVKKFLVVEEIAFKSSVAAGDFEVGDGGITVLVQVGEAAGRRRKKRWDCPTS